MLKVCYLIIAHKNPKQLNLLIDRLLRDKEAVIYMHISMPQYKTIAFQIKERERLHVIDKPIIVEWGGDNILKAQILLLENAVKENADFYQFITGQDFPIKNELIEYYRKHRGEIFLDVEESPKEEKVRLMYKWPYILSKMYNNKINIYRIIRKIRYTLLKLGLPGIKKKLPNELKRIKLYKSMFWITIDLETAKYIIEYINNTPSYLKLYENALNAEEGFWATTIMNNKDLRKKLKHENTLVYVTDFKNNHPKTFTCEDIDELNRTKCLFARKFDMDIDKEVIQYFYSK